MKAKDITERKQCTRERDEERQEERNERRK